MNDVNQVRINELARELEVKAKAIIDLLPGYGVTEKKTHSSSIPADVAEKVRKNLQGQSDAEAAADASAHAAQEAKDAAAKAARMRPAAPVAAPPPARHHLWACRLRLRQVPCRGPRQHRPLQLPVPASSRAGHYSSRALRSRGSCSRDDSDAARRPEAAFTGCA